MKADRDVLCVSAMKADRDVLCVSALGADRDVLCVSAMGVDRDVLCVSELARLLPTTTVEARLKASPLPPPAPRLHRQSCSQLRPLAPRPHHPGRLHHFASAPPTHSAPRLHCQRCSQPRPLAPRPHRPATPSAERQPRQAMWGQAATQKLRCRRRRLPPRRRCCRRARTCLRAARPQTRCAAASSPQQALRSGAAATPTRGAALTAQRARPAQVGGAGDGNDAVPIGAEQDKDEQALRISSNPRAHMWSRSIDSRAWVGKVLAGGAGALTVQHGLGRSSRSIDSPAWVGKVLAGGAGALTVQHGLGRSWQVEQEH
eukprot:365166-Chlamydomonas_euryale.AAC.17